MVVGCHEKQPQQLLIAVAGCWALGIRNQVHTGGSVTSRDKDKELGWFMRVGAVAGSDGNGHGVVCISVDSPDEATDGAVERKASNKRRFVSSVVLK